MTDQLLSNDGLNGFRSTPKKVTNPGARWHDKPGRHKQKKYDAISEDDMQFRIYLRQNLDDEKDFSCGLALIQKRGKSLSLVRYNGSSHRHGAILYRCHIHRATAEAIAEDKKIDSYAEETNRYKTLNGALHCLIEDCKVQGLTAEPEKRGLFDDS